MLLLEGVLFELCCCAVRYKAASYLGDYLRVAWLINKCIVEIIIKKNKTEVHFKKNPRLRKALSQYFLLPQYFCLCLSPHSCLYDADWLSCLPLFGNRTESPLVPAASQEAAKDPAKDPTNTPPLSVLPLTVPQPAVAPVVFVGSVSPAATVLLMDANKIVSQTPTLSAAASATSEITQLIVQPAASQGSVLQDAPDLKVVSGVKTTQVKPFGTNVHFMIQPYVHFF